MRYTVIPAQICPEWIYGRQQYSLTCFETLGSLEKLRISTSSMRTALGKSTYSVRAELVEA